jgi:hypothetical protein
MAHEEAKRRVSLKIAAILRSGETYDLHEATRLALLRLSKRRLPARAKGPPTSTATPPSGPKN